MNQKIKNPAWISAPRKILHVDLITEECQWVTIMSPVCHELVTSWSRFVTQKERKIRQDKSRVERKTM